MIDARSRSRSQQRLRLLVRAGELFHQSLDLEETLSNVAHMAVESFAHLCLFDLLDERSGRLYVSVGAHRDPSIEPALKAMVNPIIHTADRRIHPALRVATTGTPFFAPVLDERTIVEHAASDEHEAFMRRMDYRSKIVVPVGVQAEIFGALTFIRTADADPFDIADVQVAEELGRRAGLAVANAKQFHREQHLANVLQRAFLNDDFPRRSDLQFDALYRGPENDAELGGDWYDAFETPSGKIVLTVGDVTGSGADAVRLMVQLRQWVRLAAVATDEPGRMLELLNRALVMERKERLASAFVGVLDADARTLAYASAGHPPPFLRRRGDEIVQLGASDLPLGVIDDPAYESRRVSLVDAALLALYTDGLTEVDRDPIAGERAVRRLLADEAALHAANPARFLERALAGKRTRDDLAIMTVRFGAAARRWRFDVGDVAAAYTIKRDFLRAVADEIGPDADLAACELIFGELIANALRHAPGPLSLSLDRDERGVVLHMLDEGPGFDRSAHLPDDIWSETGRGLFLISALAQGFASRRVPGCGSHIAVRLPVMRDEERLPSPARPGSIRARPANGIAR